MKLGWEHWKIEDRDTGWETSETEPHCPIPECGGILQENLIDFPPDFLEGEFA